MSAPGRTGNNGPVLVFDTGAEGMRAAQAAIRGSLRMPLDPVSKTPDRIGTLGRAWKCDLDAAARRVGEHATLAMWVVEARWAHPAWHSYMVAVGHLRPLDHDHAPLKIYVPGATHEMWVHALDQGSRELLIRTGLMARDGAASVLSPVNFAAQLVEASDEAAVTRIDAAVTDICDGRLNPDTDARAQWAARFGDNMLKGRGR